MDAGFRVLQSKGHQGFASNLKGVTRHAQLKFKRQPPCEETLRDQAKLIHLLTIFCIHLSKNRYYSTYIVVSYSEPLLHVLHLYGQFLNRLSLLAIALLCFVKDKLRQHWLFSCVCAQRFMCLQSSLDPRNSCCTLGNRMATVLLQ